MTHMPVFGIVINEEYVGCLLKNINQNHYQRKDMFKKCSKCGGIKPLKSFYKCVRRNWADGLQTRCKPCYDIAQKKYQKTEKYKKIKKVQDNKYYISLKGRYSYYKHWAKRRNIIFQITLEEFAKLWGKQCSYCGDEIKLIGIDRMDNFKGYLKDNIVPCCSKCNSMKLTIDKNNFLTHNFISPLFFRCVKSMISKSFFLNDGIY